MQQTETATKTWVTPRQLAEAVPAFTLASLRWHLFNRSQNGLASAVRKVGPRKVVIDLAGFMAWVDGQRGAEGNGHGAA